MHRNTFWASKYPTKIREAIFVKGLNLNMQMSFFAYLFALILTKVIVEHKKYGVNIFFQYSYIITSNNYQKNVRKHV